MILHELPPAKVLRLDLPAMSDILADTQAALAQMPDTFRF
jgi:hypothetical protein